MTDLFDRFAAMLDGEPAAPYDIDRVVADGRRALRRRTTLTVVVGTAGTAAVTAAVAVPIAAAQHAGPGNRISVLSSPPQQPKCELYYQAGPAGKKATKVRLAKAYSLAQAHPKPGYKVSRVVTRHGVVEFEMCPPGADTSAAPKPTAAPDPTATMPPYSYSADPQTIADGFGHELSTQVKQLGLTIIYSRAFAQETSTLEKGHPTYYDGNVDVQLPDGPADIGVQVTHAVTGLVPFDGACNPPKCEQTKLADGSVLQVSHIDAGSGGAEVIAVEIHHPNGLVVEAQESNYAFGPEATRARTKDQPLTIDQLTTLAEDPAWTF
ncbi:MAG TPA: hypothetical protein VG650_07610 [Mycobacteriales bacterium]|nr:hypothetical protein [Mycobacteriales bacterium]